MQPSETTPEAIPHVSVDTQPTQLERSTASPVPVVSEPLTPVAVPAAVTPLPDPTVVTPADLAVPITAADTDDIESTWVEQVDKIIDQNQNDPFAQEEAAESLSRDYLKKRFGIDVNKT